MPDPINVNDQTVNYQTASLLASVVGQATGTTAITAVTASQWVSVATTLKQMKSDVVMDAISQTLSKTIFSVRPYNAKFKGLFVDGVKYGNHVRKLNVVDKPFVDDPRYVLTDGQSVDPFIIDKPEILQTNIYGQVSVCKMITTFEQQLDIALSSPAEFERFIAMVMQNVADMLEQERETLARNTVNNMIAGVVTQAGSSIGTERVIYLVDEYNAATDQELTADEIITPTYFPAFAKWLFGFLKTLSERLEQRSALYHQNFVINSETKTIMRHTPADKQKCYLYGPLLNTVSSNVLSTVFLDKHLQLMDHEELPFWQSINTPMQIKCTPVYTDADGDATDAAAAVTVDNVFGVIFDEEACGIYQKDERTASQYNARGQYTNTYFFSNMTYYTDYTENCVVLLLDSAS